MSNRTYFITHSLLKKTALSRNTFINNVKTHKLYNLKNRQKMVTIIISRNFHTNTPPLLFGGGPRGSGPNINWSMLIITALAVYISSNKQK